MSEYKKVSSAVIKRLPRYYRYLQDLLQNKINRISSGELSKRMHVTASQIRQDLNCFGGFGQQGYGYNVESLYNEVGNILGVTEVFNYVIIGVGNMGRALVNYPNFEMRGYRNIAIFDKNPELIGTTMNGMVVRDVKELTREFVKQHNIWIAMLCVPYEHTREMAEYSAEIGIKGLWNFSPMDLKLPYDVVVENVHLSDLLMVLGYNLHQKYRKK